jgi:hypothetical protein
MPSKVFGGVDMFNSLVAIVAHVLSWLFVIGAAGSVLLVIPIAAYQLARALFEKDRPEETDPSRYSRPHR